MNIVPKLFQYFIILMIGCVLLYSTYFINPTFLQLFYYLITASIIIFLAGILLFKQSSLILNTAQVFFIVLSIAWIIYIVMQNKLLAKPSDGLNILFREVSYLLFIAIVISGNHLNNSYNKFYTAITVFALIEILYCFLQLFGLKETGNNNFMLTGTSVNPNITAIFLTLSIPAIFYKLYNSNGKLNFVYIVLLILLSIMLVALKCRTAMIGAAIIITLLIEWRLAILQKFSKHFNGVMNLIIPLALTCCIVALGFFVYKTKQSSADGRVMVWNIALKMIKQKPIIGYGYGSFAREYNLEQAKYFEHSNGTAQQKFNASNIQMAYNDFLENTVEGGIIGLLFLGAFFFGLIYIGIKHRKLVFNQNDNFNIYAFSAVLSCAIMAAVNFTVVSIPIMD